MASSRNNRKARVTGREEVKGEEQERRSERCGESQLHRSLKTIKRTLDFTLSENRNHWSILSRERTCYGFSLKNITLVDALGLN